MVVGWLEHRGGEVGTYELLFCSKRDAASVVVICEVVGTLNHYKMVKRIFELCALRVCTPAP